MPSNDSYVKYKVTVKNYGNVEVGISDIVGLSNDLEYSIDGYELGEIIENNGQTKTNVEKEFYITIRNKSNISEEAMQWKYGKTIQKEKEAINRSRQRGIPQEDLDEERIEIYKKTSTKI